MKQTYIITGPPGTGKSTVAEAFALRLGRSIHLHCDDIYNMVKGGYKAPWDDDGFLLDTMLTAASKVCNTYLEQQFTVVVDYVFTPEQLVQFCSRLQGKITLSVLISDLPINIDRDQQRTWTIGEERVRHFHNYYQSIQDTLKPFLINNTSISIEECIERIKSMKARDSAEVISILKRT